MCEELRFFLTLSWRIMLLILESLQRNLLMKQMCAIVEDNIDHCELLQVRAQSAGFKAVPFSSVEDFEKEDRFDFTCFLLDWNLPGKSGVELIPEIRKRNQTASIFIISANYDVKDFQYGLECGADDFIYKPYKTEELCAKLVNAYKKNEAIISLDLSRGIKFHPELRILAVAGEKIQLSRTEFHLAHSLHEARDRIVPRGELATAVEIRGEGKLLDVHIHSLRKKLETKAVKINNHRGLGYQWSNL